ncbi:MULTISPECIES: 2-oxo-4-hydroxy-4-carboxy-5-ureidoimidazoline decarboxylase [Cytobacillus]|uniref:2-oxo-4-hydroxy-4-carboxy-5-ureidoimidazoline decarboxylase n=1 Tax=Cytobacillus stercorigallinarum TaxID=2762240 RepID=A0ABR8QU09_9BACI|nr:2-oxo-4-hydroxy-4-carboxy-5-ureidoimidazoline decarboxylase [Cytobacillus stercorigallinarum]MBD7939018.1 2-oxo-4-hydroxy-4-carboxy-5-ureidoimidazoline decarboxylase [Cytobacillus stercorigallinarum]
MYTLQEINKISDASFIQLFGGVFEHSPWVAEKALMARPFSSFNHLYQTMVHIVKETTNQEKLALIKEHPNLGDRIKMSENSVNEQKNAGLNQLTEKEYKQFISMNQSYLDKFGFPFILAVRGKNKDEIYHSMVERIKNEKEEEFHQALTEIYQIALLRLEEIIIKDSITTN